MSLEGSREVCAIQKESAPDVETDLGCVPTRFVLAGLVCWASMVSMCLQMNLNLSIVAMVNQTAVHQYQNATSGNPCGLPEDPGPQDQDEDYYEESIQYEGGEFLWSSKVQGLVLGALFFGYVASHGLGGFLTQKFSCKRLMFICVLCSAGLTVLTPVATREGGPALLFALRIVQGFFMGAILPLLHCMVAHWTPVLERSVTLALAYMGGILGSSLTLILAGYLTSRDLEDGWTHVFYLTGAYGFLFCLFWFFLAHDTPDQHPNISEKEFLYITNSLSQEQSISSVKRKVPWSKLMRSIPFWSLTIVRCTHGWGTFLMQTAVPLYLQTALHIPLQLNGVMSGVMFMASAVSSITSAMAADILRRKTSLTTTTIRKIFCLLAYAGNASCCLAVSRIGCSSAGAFVLLLFAKFFLTTATAGDYAVVVDMAPKFAGPLSGILYTLSDAMGFICPLVTGIITEDDVSFASWAKVFDLCAGLLIFGLLQFLVFGSAEVQPWARGPRGDGKRSLAGQKESASLLAKEETKYQSVSNSHGTDDSRDADLILTLAAKK